MAQCFSDETFGLADEDDPLEERAVAAPAAASFTPERSEKETLEITERTEAEPSSALRVLAGPPAGGDVEMEARSALTSTRLLLFDDPKAPGSARTKDEGAAAVATAQRAGRARRVPEPSMVDEL